MVASCLLPLRGFMAAEPAPVESADFEVLTRNYYATVLAYLRAKTRNADLAFDLTQETFLQAYRNRKNFDPARGNSLQWIIGIAKNVSSNSARRSASIPKPLIHAEAIAERAWRSTDKEDEPANNRLDTLKQCLSELTERARNVLKYIYDEDRSHLEIAEKLGMELSAVKVTAFRARQTLAECMRRRTQPGGAT
jgi:RNA polymerase sigma-70 factor, ECF subfamily